MYLYKHIHISILYIYIRTHNHTHAPAPDSHRTSPETNPRHAKARDLHTIPEALLPGKEIGDMAGPSAKNPWHWAVFRLANRCQETLWDGRRQERWWGG